MAKGLKIILPLVLLILFAFPVYSEASGFSSFGDLKQKADSWIKEGDVKVSDDKIAQIMSPIAQVLVAVGAIVLVGATIIMGIKYVSASDPGTQAKLKQQLIGLVVAAIIIFGAVGIWTFVYNFLSTTF